MKPSQVAQELMRQGVRKFVFPHTIHNVMTAKRKEEAAEEADRKRLWDMMR